MGLIDNIRMERERAVKAQAFDEMAREARDLEIVNRVVRSLPVADSEVGLGSRLSGQSDIDRYNDKLLDNAESMQRNQMLRSESMYGANNGYVSPEYLEGSPEANMRATRAVADFASSNQYRSPRMVEPTNRERDIAQQGLAELAASLK